MIYCRGKDERNSTGFANNPDVFESKKKAILENAEKHDAAVRQFINEYPHGLEKYQGSSNGFLTPMLFSSRIFRISLPCGSFVVISPKENYRAILGEYPKSM